MIYLLEALADYFDARWRQTNRTVQHKRLEILQPRYALENFIAEPDLRKTQMLQC